ncbi:MAG: hypothetical protein EU535_03175 [Promethearchaeota archaeon]|nr:MAG: hypothetical protein EU535_03175 [Candidatus Lokiarchaeota archaeon]
MEKKKIIILIAIITSIGFFNLASNAQAFTINVHYFNCNKEIYYSDEIIYINASWDLIYNPNPPANEESFIQIRIFNASESVLWQSAFYYDNGTFLTGEWNISIKDLSLPSHFSQYFLSIRFSWFFEESGIKDKEIREVYVIKRNITCELLDFSPNMNYEDELTFKARFYFLENNTNLVNSLIMVKFLHVDLILYEKNYTTDSFGIIEFNLSISENLMVGNVILLLKIIGNVYFYDSEFEFQLSIYLNENANGNSKSSDLEDDNYDDYINMIFFILTIICISLVAFLLIYHNNFKKPKRQNLADLTFKY